MIRVHASLEKVKQQMETGRSLVAVMFGDSITAGSQIDPDRDETIVYHRQWHDHLLRRYPDLQLKIVNEGVPGHKITDAHDRLQIAVLDRRPDLILIEFGINDCWDGPERIDFYERELARLVERIQIATKAPIILLTANMLNFEVTPETLQMAPFAEQTARTQNAGWTDDYMDRMQCVAKRMDVPLAEGYGKWQSARLTGTDTDTLLANGANHPNRQGHRLLAEALIDLFD